jgi:hypothetical protein
VHDDAGRVMILSGNDIAVGAQLRSDLVVIGAGPAGIVCALEAAQRGVDVILVETGNRKQNPKNQNLAAANRRQPEVHAPVELTVSRQLGGTSAIWGGRCVPYDHVDFVERALSLVLAGPAREREWMGHFERACEWMVCGRSAFDVTELSHLPQHMIPGLDEGAVSTSSLERWSLPTNFGKVYYEKLRGTDNLRVVTDSTCVRINLDDQQARARDIECKTLAGHSFTVAADNVIVATGGLESTRLLMCSPGQNGKSLGDHSGQLGHWYMAHMEGVIADMVLSVPVEDSIYGYERDIDGSYVRRRFTFAEDYLLEHGLPNVSGWIANPELSDASHRSAALSLAYLALISPFGFILAPPAQRLSLTGTNIPGTPYGMATRSPVSAHLRNLLRHPIDAIRFSFDFGIKRVFSRRRKPPGFVVANRTNRFPFQYHAEHLPHFDSCVKLSDVVDDVGMPKLDIDIEFTDEDIEGVVQAHEHLDKQLRASGVGRLDYLAADLLAAVRARSGGGFHQIGTTRMSKDSRDGVVDENLAVHGIPNLYVVSSSVFVTAGQANSTFMIVVFAIRLIERLFGERRCHA